MSQMQPLSLTQGPLLTLSQCQGSLLATGISKGEHGSVSVEQRQGFVQERFP